MITEKEKAKLLGEYFGRKLIMNNFPYNVFSLPENKFSFSNQESLNKFMEHNIKQLKILREKIDKENLILYGDTDSVYVKTNNGDVEKHEGGYVGYPCSDILDDVRMNDINVMMFYPLKKLNIPSIIPKDEVKSER